MITYVSNPPGVFSRFASLSPLPYSFARHYRDFAVKSDKQKMPTPARTTDAAGQNPRRRAEDGADVSTPPNTQHTNLARCRRESCPKLRVVRLIGPLLVLGCCG